MNFKHKNKSDSPIAIFDSKGERFELLPGETVVIDKDSSGQGVVLIEKIRTVRRAKIIKEEKESEEELSENDIK